MSLNRQSASDQTTRKGVVVAALSRVAIAGTIAATLNSCSDNYGLDIPSPEADLSGVDATFSELNLRCQLTASDEHSRVRIDIHNDGPHDISVSSWGSPWDLHSNSWSVTSAGSPAKYRGIIALKRQNLNESYVTISRGATFTATYDVAANYHLSDGDGVAKPTNRILSARVDGELMSVLHNCDAVSIKKDSNDAFDAVNEDLIYNTGSNCSTNDQAVIESAEQIARYAATLSASASTTTNGIFARWFGSGATSTNAAYVAARIGDINSDWTTFTGDCYSTATDSNDDVICSTATAWVSGADWTRVHLCSGFFEVPSFSVYASSSQAGVLAHEKAHLVSSGAVTDQTDAVCTDGGSTACYGAADALALASTNPTKASKNGENYEHFVSDIYLTQVLVPALF